MIYDAAGAFSAAFSTEIYAAKVAIALKETVAVAKIHKQCHRTETLFLTVPNQMINNEKTVFGD